MLRIDVVQVPAKTFTLQAFAKSDALAYIAVVVVCKISASCVLIGNDKNCC